MSGPAWECPPERLANGRVIYRCMYGHMHSYPSAAWACGPADRKSHSSGSVPVEDKEEKA